MSKNFIFIFIIIFKVKLFRIYMKIFTILIFWTIKLFFKTYFYNYGYKKVLSYTVVLILIGDNTTLDFAYLEALFIVFNCKRNIKKSISIKEAFYAYFLIKKSFINLKLNPY